MSLFSLKWFRSNNQEKLEKLELEKKEKELELLNLQLKESKKLYKVLSLVNNNLTVVLQDGSIISKSNATENDVQEIKLATSESEILRIVKDVNIQQEKITEELTIEDIEMYSEGFKSFQYLNDFYTEGNTVYLSGTDRSLPELLVKKFIKIIDKYKNCPSEYLQDALDNDEEYLSHKKFFMWCCLNPNAQSAEDLYGFLEKHNMKIDRHGNFYAYRRVKTVGNDSKELVDFISNAYNKIKAVWKKSPKKFKVVTIPDSKEFKLKEWDFNVENTEYVCLGDLEYLYLNLPNMKENRYTSAHTGKEDYRVGNVISMPRNEGDDNNSVSCSMGFHAASKEYDYSGFGDQDILVIINPMDVLAVPKGEVGKLRTCRWFFAMTLEKDERYILDEEDFNVLELGDVYNEKCFEDIEEHVKNGFTEEVKRHTFTLPTLSSKELSVIINSLEEMTNVINSRVVELN